MSLSRRRFLALAGLGALGVATPACRPMLGPPGSSPPAASPYRLPQSVVPLRYQIRLEPDLRAFAFAGEETIEVLVREPVEDVVLNAADLQIREVMITDESGVGFPGTSILDPATERARLTFPETLKPGPWRLQLRFAGVLSDRLQGFYRSTVKGRTREGRGEGILAVTDFEPTDARRAFPCWDEPAFKAVFQLTLVVDKALTALSNTRIVGERRVPGTGKKVVTFAPTIKMSSYLVAVVVGELEATEAVMVNGVPLRIWCVPGKKHLARIAQETAAFALRFFEEYYGMRYPGDKLDLIAIPDFASAAMENLGAIVFRETALLVDEAAATPDELQRVTDQVAHELAHMWFGDLVTMAWWNGLWLNEAFATFMQLLAVDAWRPAWERWASFGVSRAAALQLDGLRTARPIEFEVVAPKDAEAMFDAITYEKGAAVLRMLEQYLGPDAFRTGVRKYLATHEFGNTETADLWRALDVVAPHPVRAIMDEWIFRPGHPLVTVRSDATRRALHFSQRRFTYLADGALEAQRWKIPISFRVRVNGAVERRRLLLSSTEERVELPGSLDWVVVNEGGHGFYRTRYAADLLDALTAVPSTLLTPMERFNLIDDAWAAALASLLPADQFLELTARFRDEPHRSVWTALIGALTSLGRIVGPGNRPALEAVVRDRLGPAVARLGWSPAPGERELTRQLRADLLRAIGTLGNDAPTQAEARAIYARYRDDPSAADPAIVPALIAILAWSGGEADYAHFLDKVRTAKTPQEERRYLFALAGFHDPDVIQQTLRLTLSGDVRNQDAPFLVRSLLLSVPAREPAWRFVKENWRTMERRYAPSGLIRMCEGLVALATPELETDVREFFASRGITLGGRTLDRYLEELRVAVAFGVREAARLTAYLSRFQRAQ